MTWDHCFLKIYLLEELHYYQFIWCLVSTVLVFSENLGYFLELKSIYQKYYQQGIDSCLVDVEKNAYEGTIHKLSRDSSSSSNGISAVATFRLFFLVRPLIYLQFSSASSSVSPWLRRNLASILLVRPWFVVTIPVRFLLVGGFFSSHLSVICFFLRHVRPSPQRENIQYNNKTSMSRLLTIEREREMGMDAVTARGMERNESCIFLRDGFTVSYLSSRIEAGERRERFSSARWVETSLPQGYSDVMDLVYSSWLKSHLFPDPGGKKQERERERGASTMNACCWAAEVPRWRLSSNFNGVRSLRA